MELSHTDKQTDFILYHSPSGKIKVNVRIKDDTLWLSQKHMSELFWVDVTTVNEHLKNIYKTWELEKMWTIGNFPIVQKEWNREVSRIIKFYNLDAIIAVWYRVNSAKATQFRIWATGVLRDFIVKWFVMDDDRLKNWQHFWKDYFKELLERVRSIRASERRIYLQITDIFAECSIDYDKHSQITKDFYATIQNKFHFAITKKTAAEIIYENADKEKSYMGLTSWKNGPKWRIIKSDTTIAKNYLSESEMKKLERTISSYFDYIENHIEQEKEFTMELLSESVNKFLDFNDFKVLDGRGKISKQQADKKAHAEYEQFNKIQRIDSDFEKRLKKR